MACRRDGTCVLLTLEMPTTENEEETMEVQAHSCYHCEDEVVIERCPNYHPGIVDTDAETVDLGGAEVPRKQSTIINRFVKNVLSVFDR